MIHLIIFTLISCFEDEKTPNEDKTTSVYYLWHFMVK